VQCKVRGKGRVSEGKRTGAMQGKGEEYGKGEKTDKGNARSRRRAG
jgi:hypothetical protein